MSRIDVYIVDCSGVRDLYQGIRRYLGDDAGIDREELLMGEVLCYCKRERLPIPTLTDIMVERKVPDTIRQEWLDVLNQYISNILQLLNGVPGYLSMLSVERGYLLRFDVRVYD